MWKHKRLFLSRFIINRQTIYSFETLNSLFEIHTWELLDRVSVSSVGDADFHLLEPVQNIELGQGNPMTKQAQLYVSCCNGNHKHSLRQ